MPTNARRASRSPEWGAVQIGSAASLIVCALIALQVRVVGSYWGNWVYAYIQPVGFSALFVFAIAAAVAIGAVTASADAIHRHEWTIVAGWALIGVLLQLLLRSLTPFGFEQIFASNGANAFYSVTLDHRLTDLLADFSRVRLTFPLHPRSNMPGKLMLVYALELVSTRPLALAWLLVLLSNLGGVLLYAFVRDWFADPRAALYALVLYLLVPGKLYFLPLLNTVTPTVLFACAYPFVRWLRTGRRSYAALAGISTYGLVLFEPLPLVMALAFGIAAVTMFRRTGTAVTRFAVDGAVFLLAFAIVHAAVYWLWGFNAIGAFRDLAAEAVAFNNLEHRRYLIWVWQNLIDFAVATGVCQSAIFVTMLGTALRGRLTDPLSMLCLSLAAVLLVTNLAGVNRGEVVRLWIFLACLFQVPAAYVCSRLNGRLAISLVIATTLLQDAIGTQTIGFIVPG